MNCHILLRFEIVDDTVDNKSDLQNLRFTASNYQQPYNFEAQEQNYDDLNKEKESANCLGFRIPQKYTLETVNGEDFNKLMMTQNKDRSLLFNDQNNIKNDEEMFEMGEQPRNSIISKSSYSNIGESIRFLYGNPSIETFEGIVHLYKDKKSQDDCSSTLILILAIPATKTTQDILLFLGPVSLWLEHLKIVRDATPNQYMVLLKFKTQKHAVDFFTNFNGKPWNSVEAESVHLIYVSSVEVLSSSEGASLPIFGITELPTCPVCLERMDESVDGILTILCNHSFHGSCLAKWSDTSCPVCRYIQTPEQEQENMCVQCEAKYDLWICLVCGYIGCGRYVAGHASQHYKLTQHTYSMQLGENRVWDYAGDNYVHRLIQSSSGDGKLVQVTNEHGNSLDDKTEDLQLEYTYILASQLETQRLFFQEKLDQYENEQIKHREELEEQCRHQLTEIKDLTSTVVNLKREKKLAEQKQTQILSSIQQIKQELNEEKQHNKCLRDNQIDWTIKCKELNDELLKKNEEIKELKEQLRDIMLSLEMSQKLSEEIDENEGATSTLSIGAIAPSRSRHKKGRK